MQPKRRQVEHVARADSDVHHAAPALLRGRPKGHIRCTFEAVVALATSGGLFQCLSEAAATVLAGACKVAEGVHSRVEVPRCVRRQEPKVLGAVQLRVNVVLRVVMQWGNGAGGSEPDFEMMKARWRAAGITLQRRNRGPSFRELWIALDGREELIEAVLQDRQRRAAVLLEQAAGIVMHRVGLPKPLHGHHGR